MSDSKKILALVAVILGLGVLVFKSSQHKQEVSAETAAEETTFVDHSETEAGGGAEAAPAAQALNSGTSTSAVTPATLPEISAEAAALKNTPLNSHEIKAVGRLTVLLSKVGTTQSARVESVMNEIKALGLIPQKSVDENPHTGRLTIIRTSNALQGTRYLHVQMPGMNPKDEFVQMMTFQVRPGKDSFAKTVEMMQKSLPAGSRIVGKSDESVTWSIEGGKEARVEILNSMDALRASKYDAVSPDDIGTVKATVEIAIHEMEGDEHDHD